MRLKPISHVVMEYFKQADQPTGTVNEILSFYLDKYGSVNSRPLKKVRHAIYQKADRLRKEGDLIITGKNGNFVTYGLPMQSNAPKDDPSAIAQHTNKTEIEALQAREASLKYDLDRCIAEAEGYEELKSMLPKHASLLNIKKEEAKKQAIHLSGLLSATLVVMDKLSS